MKERNIILEGKLKSWLLSVDIEKLAAKQQGQLILGLEKLYQATGDADYHTFAKKAVDNLVAEDGTYAKAEGSLSDNLFGNALFAVRAMDTVYNPQDTAAEKTEKAILKQEKVMTSGARFDATETCAGTFSTKLSDAYLTQNLAEKNSTMISLRSLTFYRRRHIRLWKMNWETLRQTLKWQRTQQRQ